MSDETARLRDGTDDQQRWREWYRAVYPRLFFHLVRKTNGNQALSEELAQGAFERFVRFDGLGKVADNEQAVAYLRRIGLRMLADYLATLVEVSTVQADTVAGPGDTPPSETIEHLAAALGDDEKRLLRLLVEGWTVSEIAERLGISYSAASKRLQRLRQALAAAREDIKKQSLG